MDYWDANQAKEKIIVFFFLLISTFKVASASQYNEDLKKFQKKMALLIISLKFIK